MKALFYMSSSIMKKPKNKFILAVIAIIACIIFSQVYIAFSHKNTDTNSYLTLLEWQGTLNENLLEIQDKNLLKSWDTIRIIWDASLGIVEWGDGSLTRLGGNTKISIEQNQISRDYSTINISFQLIAGKTWSNVVSFIGKDSSFTQSFQWIEAGVRGTVFDVDLDNEYIHVSDHQVELLLDGGKKLLLEEGKALNISNFSLIELEEFLKNIQDTAWIELNERFDTAYSESLKAWLQDSLEASSPLHYIMPFTSTKFQLLQALAKSNDYKEVQQILENISPNERDEMYAAVLSKYQNINFITARDYEFYKRKVFYKKALITLGSPADTQGLVRSSVYDLQDMLELWDTNAVSDTLNFLSEHKNTLEDIDSSFLSDSIAKLPNKLWSELQEQLQGFEGILDFSLPSPEGIDVGTFEQKARDSIKSIDSGVQEFIGEKAGNLLDQFAR